MLIHKIENRLREEVYVKKYIRQLQKTFDRIESEIMKIFVRVNRDGKWSNSELAKYNRKMNLRQQIRKEIKLYKTSFVNDFRDDLAKLYKNETLFTQRLLKNVPELGITTQLDKLPVNAIKSQVVDQITIKGKTMFEYVSKYSEDIAFRVEQEVFESIALGENPLKTSKRLGEFADKVGKTRVEMTTRSWTNAIYNQSNLDVYQQANLKKVRLLATLDTRTCPICAADHNKVFILGEQPFLPQHPNCRCAYSPYIDDELTGPARSYDNWLLDRNRNPEQLETALGNVSQYLEKGFIKNKEGEFLRDLIIKNMHIKGLHSNVNKWYNVNNVVLPNYQKAINIKEKLLTYSLDENHETGKDKAKGFKQILGYDISNANDLIKQIKEKISYSKAVYKGFSKYGYKYEVDIMITGPTGNSERVRTAWIFDYGSDIPRATSIYVKPIKKRSGGGEI